MTSLVVSGNAGLVSLPDSLGGLSGLKSLLIYNNAGLVSLPDSICQIPDLYSILEADDNGDGANMDDLACDVDESKGGGDELKIGYILPLTGLLGLLGDPMVKGFELAAREVNLAGYQVVVSFAGDSGTDQEKANNTADQHLTARVHGIVGAAASGITLAVIDKITGAQIPMISPSNTSPTFTTYEDGGYYFRTSASDQLQGKVLANLVLDNEGENVAILYRADDYGQGLARVAQEQLEAGGANVALSLAYDPWETSFQSEVQQIAAAADGAVDSVVLVAFNEGQKVIRQMIATGLGPMPLISTYLMGWLLKVWDEELILRIQG